MNQTNASPLEPTIEHFFALGTDAIGDAGAMAAFLELRTALESGALRSAEPEAASPTGWRLNAWVKRGILLGFRLGQMFEMGCPDGFRFVDKATYPARRFAVADGVRIVPGGSSVRSGAYLAKGVVVMPPAYVNVGAYIDEGTMVDSHALVGSCAQIGKRVHLSAAAQIGGVLEPVGASPVIIEDEALVGGNSGVYEGTIVRRRAGADPRHSGLRPGQRHGTQGELRDAADYPGRRGRRSGVARDRQRPRRGVGSQRLHAADREVPQPEDRAVAGVGGSAAVTRNRLLLSDEALDHYFCAHSAAR